MATHTHTHTRTHARTHTKHTHTSPRNLPEINFHAPKAAPFFLDFFEIEVPDSKSKSASERAFDVDPLLRKTMANHAPSASVTLSWVAVEGPSAHLGMNNIIPDNYNHFYVCVADPPRHKVFCATCFPMGHVRATSWTCLHTRACICMHHAQVVCRTCWRAD